MKTLISLLLLVTIFSCQKPEVPEDTPKCVKKKIKIESDNGLDKVYKNVYLKNALIGQVYVTYYWLVYAQSNDTIGNFISEDCIEFDCNIKEPISPPQGANNCYDNIHSSELIWTSEN